MLRSSWRRPFVLERPESAATMTAATADGEAEVRMAAANKGFPARFLGLAVRGRRGGAERQPGRAWQAQGSGDLRRRRRQELARVRVRVCGAGKRKRDTGGA